MRVEICRLSDILKRHMETNNRERIFNCVQCKKSFGSAGHLNQHRFTHSGEKMHICSECMKSFGRAGTLKTHMLIHIPQWRKDPHLLRMQEVIWSSRTFEGTHDHPQQRKSIRLCPMPKVIWSSYIFEKTHAHSQWSEGTLLLRM